MRREERVYRYDNSDSTSTSTTTTDSGSDIMGLVKSLGVSAVAGAATGGVGWLTAIPSLFKLGASLFQGIKGNKLSKTPRPVYSPPQYSIPPEVQQYLNKTENKMLDPNLPGQSIMEQKLGANTSSATSDVMKSGHTSGDILNTISKIYSGENDATNALGVKAAENYQSLVQKKDADVSQALLTSAGYKDKKYEADLGRYKDMFQINQLDPFMQASGAASALKNASGRNLYGGVKDLASVASLMAMLKKIKGNNGGNTSNSSSTGMWDFSGGNESQGEPTNNGVNVPADNTTV